MKRARNSFTKRCLPALLVVAAAEPAFAQLRRPPVQEPQWLRAQLTQTAAGFYVEAMHEEINRSTGSSSYDRLFFGPSVGLGFRGSIYHPNLAQFSVTSDLAFGWTEQSIDTGTTVIRRSEFDYFGNFNANVFVFSGRPYSATLFASQNHIFRNYDFFNSVTVDSWRYGGTFGYSTGPVPVKVTVWHRTEDTSGLTDTFSVEETGLTFEAVNPRTSGTTTFNYTFNDYARTDGGVTTGGTDQTFGLSDTEEFGSRKQIRLNTALGYSRREYTDSPGNEFNAMAGLSIEHRPKLTTFYDVAFYRFDNGSGTANNLSGSAAVRHQLYDSLTSTLRLRVMENSSEGEGGGSETIQYGVNLSEGYTKQLSESSRLSLNGAWYFDHTDQKNSGSTIPAFNEAHTFGGGGLERITLNLPFATIGTIVVREAANPLHVYALHTDYEIIQNGALTFIERSALSTIPSGSSVLVDYTADSSPSGSYDSWGGSYQVRLDFFNGLLGIFARLNTADNNAPPQLVAQETFAYSIGADVSWRWFRAGVEYEVYHSSFSNYRTARAFQSFTFRPDEVSSFSVDFNEARTEYLDAHRVENYFSFITRYHRAMTSHLAFDLEGGVSQRMGEGVDETRATVRPGIRFNMGRLSLKAGYDFEYNNFLDREERVKHLLFVRASRSF